MKRRTLTLPALLVAASLAAGCGDSGTAPGDPRLTAGEAAALAAAIDASTWEVGGSGTVQAQRTDADAAAADPWTRRESFSLSVPCPRGGSVAVAGVIDAALSLAARSLSLDVDATRTHTGCAFEIREEDSGRAVTVTTTGAVQMTARRAFVDGTPDGPQTQTHRGELTWSTSTGRQGTCALDVTSSFQRNAGTLSWTRTVQGSVCGWTVDSTATWTPPAG